jgi:hypothetical protein
MEGYTVVKFLGEELLWESIDKDNESRCEENELEAVDLERVSITDFSIIDE